jgi:gamma-glutamylputrescine oxidase
MIHLNKIDEQHLIIGMLFYTQKVSSMFIYPNQESSSYWQATTERVALSENLPAGADVAIVGGGILGAATCYWLSRSGISTVLLERDALAYGATGRNGGFVSTGPAEGFFRTIKRQGPEIAQSVLQMTIENQQSLHNILQEEGINCDYRTTGNIHIALHESEWNDLVQDSHALQQVGITMEMLEHQSLQKLIKTPLSNEIPGGRFNPIDAVIHPIKLVQGLIAAAQQHGAHVYKATVTQLEARQGSLHIHTTRGSLSAKKVIVATNAWISTLLPIFAPFISPVRGQMLAYAPIPAIFSTGMGASITPTGEYWQQRPDGVIILGGCRAVAHDFDVGLKPNQPTQEVQTALEKVLPTLFPQLKDLQVKQRWAGLMAFTPDYLPIADQVPDMPGVWAVGGFSGHGMPFGLRMSQLLADEVIHDTKSTKLQPFRLERFHD